MFREGSGLPSRRRHRGAFATLALVVCLADAATASAEEPQNVILLYSHSRQLPALMEVEAGLRETLTSSPARPLEFFIETLDFPRFSGDRYNQLISSYLREKYATRPPSLIVAVAEESLGFLLLNRSTLFPDIPIVHVGVQKHFLDAVHSLPAAVVGVPVEYSAKATAETALRWHPDRHHLVVVTGAAAWDRDWTARLHEELKPLQSQVRLEFLSALPMADLTKRLAALKKDAVVLTVGFFLDGAGRVTFPAESVGLVAAAATAPVYGPSETFIGTGVVGGWTPNFRAMGRQAGLTADKVLRGAAPASLSLPVVTPTQLHVDWCQVRRWGIPAAAIPSDAVTHFREPTLWEEHRTLVLVTLGVVVVQAGLIASLLLEGRRRRRMAKALEESEQRMVLASNAAGLSSWVWDIANGEVWARDPARAQGKPMVRTADFPSALSVIHAADRERVESAFREAVHAAQEFDVEYRVVEPDGTVHWKVSRGRADEGNSSRLRGVTLDISDRKKAELQAVQDRTALRHMTRVSLLGQLSASIAHQLYQPLAAALSNAEAAQEMLAKDNVDLVELRAICDDIVAEEHRATDVIAGIRALFRKGELKLQPIDLNKLVDDTLTLVHTDLVMRHVTPTTALSPALPIIEGDRVQLQQVLLNLVLNAADAMGRHGNHEKKLTIRTDEVGEDVRVQVTDTGPGIAQSDLKSVFDAFWSTKPEGVGIGLAVCQSIVTTHRGNLTAFNNPEGGATFAATFPRRASA
jgi:signal transduction histidine kinase/ABC-type uncharacterized transport system substrate-binding protein